MACNTAPVSQLVPSQLRNSSAVRTTFRVAACVGCMHCVVSMLVQLNMGIKPKIALCTSVLVIGMMRFKVRVDINRLDFSRTFWNRTAKGAVVRVYRMVIGLECLHAGILFIALRAPNG